MRRILWVALFAFGIIGTIAYCLTGGSAVGTAAPAPNDENPFAGKALLIYGKNSDHGAVVENAAFRHLGGRTFLVGKSFDTDENGTVNPMAGKSVWMALEDVGRIVEFDNKDEVKKAYRQWAELRNARGQ